KLPLFISATCEFTRYDDPSRVSAGEEMYLSNQGGAISLMTTTRPVSISGNSIIGDTLYNYLFERETSGKPYTMGEILRLTKNNSPSGNDKRIFTLIGDPALRLLLQPLRIVIDSVNGISPNTISDTLKSLSKVTMKAHVEDTLGNIINGFNGIAYPSVFDKPKLFKTLGQDPDSPILSFQMQKNYLYKGKSTVTNGHFEFSFVVPKDIDYNYGVGKISTYANSTSIDAAGVEKRVVIGGVDPNGIVDDIGPQTQLFMNDETFVNQGLTDENPIFIAKLYDENGINTVGNGIGHDITAILDANSATPIVLNQYYQANLDTYKSGKVRYPMYGLATGKHTITLKVWDVNNNSSDAVIEFTVVKNQAVAIDHVLNYPNPFTTHTEFFFEHNQVDVSLEVQIQIMTITGKLIRTINQYVRTVGYRSEGIAWDGRDDYGDQLAKGVYVYKLSVKAPDGSTANKIEKLVLLK
ncbi:MAG: type IX secretion system sortase PorU, partial [Crocinitomicaceae bacterium]